MVVQNKNKIVFEHKVWDKAFASIRQNSITICYLLSGFYNKQIRSRTNSTIAYLENYTKLHFSFKIICTYMQTYEYIPTLNRSNRFDHGFVAIYFANNTKLNIKRINEQKSVTTFILNVIISILMAFCCYYTLMCQAFWSENYVFTMTQSSSHQNTIANRALISQLQQ